MNNLEDVPSQAGVLFVNHGDVVLAEKEDQSQVYLVPTSAPLPSKAHPTTNFDKNKYFRHARQVQKEFVAILSPRGTVLIVPTKPYASIKDFCVRATSREYMRLWTKIMLVRFKLEQAYQGKFYIETIGFHVPQLHIRLVRKDQRFKKPKHDAQTQLWLSQL